MSDWYAQWQNNRSSSRKRFKKILTRLGRIKEQKLQKVAEGAHQRVFDRIDCLECANCCTSIPPLVNDTDTRRLARHLGLKEAQFRDTYLTQDEDGDTVMNTSPCPFLGEDNKCDVYEVRPKACRQYPHTGDHSFAKHLKLHQVNVRYCPAVYHILIELDQAIQ